ncbi:LemA family protein [bacterium]|nr:LemA family protein [bacterium]
MDTTTLLVLGSALVMAIILYASYASVIRAKNKVKEAFSSINVQLKKRYDLMPNILTLAAKFMEHEKSLLEDLTKLRTEVLSLPNNYENIERKLDLDNQIKAKMQQFMVSVENYPELKSDSTMITAMQTYNEVEEHIAAARRFFNSAVNDLNNLVETFPSSMFAQRMGIKTQEFFEINPAETKPINASDFFNK